MSIAREALQSLFRPVAICSMALIASVACVPEAPEADPATDHHLPTAAASTTSAACLLVQQDLWEEEEQSFKAIQDQFPHCAAGPVDDASSAMEWLRSGLSELAILSGSIPAENAQLLRTEPYVLVANVASPLDDVPLAWVRDLFSGEDDLSPVIVGEGQAEKELLGIGQLASGAVAASSWREARETVMGNRRLLALLPWREVDFRVRALAIDGQGKISSGECGCPLQRRWWLVGQLEDHPALSEAIRQGLELEVEPLVSLVAVGDVMLGRGIGTVIAANSPQYPFLLTEEATGQADITFGNLESPITSGGAPGGGIALRAEPEVVQGLRYAGFDVLSLANNHSVDYGDIGLRDTMAYLDSAQIVYVGVGVGGALEQEAVTLEAKGLTIAFLAYNHVGPRFVAPRDGVSGPAWLEPDAVYADVRRAARNADFVVVSLHWGAEYVPLPDEFQQEVVAGVLEAGAGLVLGHHSHVIGGVDFQEKGFAAYSLGNFVFDQPFSLETKQGLMLQCLIDGSGLKQVRLIPVQSEAGQPHVLPPAEARSVLSGVFEISEAQGGLPSGVHSDVEDIPVAAGLEEEWSIQLPGRATALRTCPLDGDGEPEIVAAAGQPGGPSSVFAFDTDGSILWEHDSPRQVNDLECEDLDSDGRSEVVAASGLLDAPGEVFVLGADGQLRWTAVVEASVLDIALGDITGDGLVEVAAGEWGSFGETIYLWDSDGDLLWKHPTDGSVFSVRIADLDGDDVAEVIAGADDVYVLDGRGELLWRYRTTGYVEGLGVANGTAAGTRQVLPVTGYPDSSIVALDSDGALAWRYEPGASPSVTLDGELEVDSDALVVGSADGTVHLLTSGGTLRWETQPGDPISALAWGDVNADGIGEIVVGTGDHFSGGDVYILDSATGAVLGFIEGREGATILDVRDMDGKGGDEIVAAWGGGEVLLLRWWTE